MVHEIWCQPSRHRIPLRTWWSRRHWEVERTIGSAKLGSLHIWTLAQQKKMNSQCLVWKEGKRGQVRVLTMAQVSLKSQNKKQLWPKSNTTPLSQNDNVFTMGERNSCFQEFHRRWKFRGNYLGKRRVRNGIEWWLPFWWRIRGATGIVIHVIYILHVRPFPLATVELNTLLWRRNKTQ